MDNLKLGDANDFLQLEKTGNGVLAGVKETGNGYAMYYLNKGEATELFFWLKDVLEMNG